MQPEVSTNPRSPRASRSFLGLLGIGLACIGMACIGMASMPAMAAPDGGGWSTTGSMPQALNSHVAGLLADGRAIVAGGAQNGTYRDDTYLYDPATSAWTAGAAMPVERNRHSGVVLGNGRFLVVGGISNFGPEMGSTVYDPATNTWSSAGLIATGRQDQTATLLSSGKVLLAGGGIGALDLTEIYDPASNSWSAGPNLVTGRMRHAAVRLANGKVLIMGGVDQNNLVVANAELYDPTTNTFSATGSMTTARRYHTATLLSSGQVLVVGGEDNMGVLSSSELYNPGTGTWTVGGTLSTPRDGAAAALLPDGRVLVSGGVYGQPSAEVYNPAFNSWSPAGSMAAGRYFHTATLLGNGQVLVAGGIGDDGTMASAELYGGAGATYTVTPSAGSNGSITPSTPQTVNQNAQATFTVTAAAGYVAAVGGTCGGDLAGTTYTTNPITADCTVVASFSAASLTVTPFADEHGSINPPGPQSVQPGEHAVFLVVPDAGYQTTMGGTCGGNLVGTTYTTDAVVADCSVIASFTPQMFAVTPSAGAHGTISPDTTQMVAPGTSLEFTLAAEEGYAVAVSGTCGGSLAGNTFTTNPVSQDCTVIASFNAVSYTVQPSATGNGTISPSTPQTVMANTTTTFTVIAAPGHVAAVSGTCGGTLAGTTYTTAPITGDCTVDASFAVATHTVTPSAGAHGTITPATPQTIAEGATALFVLAPDPGYSASVGGTCGGVLEGNTYTTNPITADCTVVASFAANNHTVTASAGAHGSISPSGAQQVGEGLTASFTVAANSGYQASVGGTCGGALVGTTYTTAPITADCSVVASFSQTMHTVTPSAGANGAISPSTPVAVAEGASTTFTLTPAPGYAAVVGGTCGGTLAGNTYTTNPITADCTVAASFTGDIYIVTPSVDSEDFSPPALHGSISPSTPQAVAFGDTPVFTLIPDEGYEGSVTGTCGGLLTSNEYTVAPVHQDCTVIAHFTPSDDAPLTVTPSAGPNGSISPSTPQVVAPGESATFTLSPDFGYQAMIGGTCGGILSGNTFTTKPVVASCTVMASFVPEGSNFIVSASAGSHGTISPAGNLVAEAGQQLAFVVTADLGYHASVGGTCGGAFDGIVYTTSPINGNCSVEATFSADSSDLLVVTPSSGPNGSIAPYAPQSVPFGAIASFTVTPAPGFIASAGGTCGGVLVGNRYVTNRIVMDCTVTFGFSPIDYSHIVNLNQHGIAGSWASPDVDNQGLVIDVYPDINGPGMGVLFAGWFTFDTNPAGGQRWYTLQGVVQEGQGTAILPIYSTVGGTFGGGDPTLTTQVGTSLLMLSDCNNGILAYAFNDGRSGIIQLQRLIDNITCGQDGDNGAPGLNYLNSGAMADRNAEGQGFVFDFNPSRQFLFAGWYTFSPTADISPPAQDASGQRWFTLQTPFVPGISSLADIPIYESLGGTFNRYGPAIVRPVGTATLTINGCESITVAYTFTDGEFAGISGTLENHRLAAAPLGCQSPGGP